MRRPRRGCSTTCGTATAGLADALRIGDRVAFAATARAIRRDEARLASRLAAWQRVLALPGSGPR